MIVDWIEFFRMGKHGIYVWPAFGLTLAVLAANVIFARRRLASIREQVRRRVASVGGQR